ncbi:MAG: hypothetical protein ACRDP6_25410 [Actinoallomurus sp.]
MLLGFATAIVLLLMATARSADPGDAGRTSVMGSIGRTGLGPERDAAEVDWQDDRTMTPRTVRFHFFYPGDWNEGEAFGISYDPDDPSGPVFAAPGYTDYVDDGSPLPWWTFPLVATPGIVLCAVFWLSRGWFNRRARSAPMSEWRAQLCLGSYRGVANNAQLMLTPADGTGRRWQRVFWSPALARLTVGRTVRARVRRGFFGRAIVEVADGSLIWPLGRLRKSPSLTPVTWPRTWTFTRPPMGGLMWAILLVAPILADVQVNDGSLGLRMGSMEFAAFTAYVYAFYFHLWGCAGGVFARTPYESMPFMNTPTLDGL